MLIRAVASGVGHFAVQFPKWKGAKLIGTASALNEEFVKKPGADIVIDYTTKKFENEVSGIDCVLDTQAGEILDRSVRILEKDRITVSTLNVPSAEKLARLGVRSSHVLARADSRQLMQITELIDAGDVRPVGEAVLQRAHEMSQIGHVRGKTILKIRE